MSFKRFFSPPYPSRQQEPIKHTLQLVPGSFNRGKVDRVWCWPPIPSSAESENTPTSEPVMAVMECLFLFLVRYNYTVILAYADDIHTIECSQAILEEAFIKLEKVVTEIYLKINRGKLSICK
jgi:hypothetical protein